MCLALRSPLLLPTSPNVARVGGANLLLVLVTGILVALVSGLGLLSPDTAVAASAEGRGESEVDVLLGVETDDEGRNVDNLLADAVERCLS